MKIKLLISLSPISFNNLKLTFLKLKIYYC